MKMVMRKQFKIRSFDDLIDFIENEDAPKKDIGNIISNILSVWVWSSQYKDKKELIKDLREYWSKWKNKRERPIFLCNIDLEAKN